MVGIETGGLFGDWDVRLFEVVDWEEDFEAGSVRERWI